MAAPLLTQKDRKVITAAAVLAVVVAALLVWGYFVNQRKAAEPKSLMGDLVQTLADDAKARQQQRAQSK